MKSFIMHVQFLPLQHFCYITLPLRV